MLGKMSFGIPPLATKESEEDLLKAIIQNSISKKGISKSKKGISKLSTPKSVSPIDFIMNEMQSEKPQYTLGNRFGPPAPREEVEEALVGDIAEQNVPVQDTKSVLMEKLKQLEGEYSKPLNIKGPTNLGDIGRSIGDVISGGKQTESGGRDFVGSLLDILGNASSYASTGQGLMAIGAATGNRSLIERGIERSQKESDQQREVSIADDARKKNLFDVYKAMGDIEGINRAPAQIYKDAVYVDAEGTRRRGKFNEVSGQFLTSPDDPEAPGEKPDLIEMKDALGNIYQMMWDSKQKKLVRAPGSFVGKESRKTYKDPYTGQEKYLDNDEVVGAVSVFTPKENEYLIGSEKGVLSRLQGPIGAKANAQAARSMLDNPTAIDTLKSKLLRMAGESGNTAVAEKQNLGSSAALQDAISQKLETWKSGKLSKENRAWTEKLISDFEQEANDRINDEINARTDTFMALYPEADRKAAYRFYSRAANRGDSYPAQKKNNDDGKKSSTGNGGNKNAPKTITSKTRSGKTVVIKDTRATGGK